MLNLNLKKNKYFKKEKERDREKNYGSSRKFLHLTNFRI